jgi:transposase
MILLAMAHISGRNRSQRLLLPESVEDYIGTDNPVRFIDAFVDSLDLEASGFVRASPKATGRPGYDPADLLKLYIYGYLNRVRSSRRLEVETHRNMEVIWLLRQLMPDFKTIADFRKNNKSAFRQIFREFVALCRSLDLYGSEVIAVDGSRIKAVNGRDRNFSEAKLKKAMALTDARLERYLKQLDDEDSQDDRAPSDRSDSKLQEKIAAIQAKKLRLQEHFEALEASSENQISLTDPDSRAMHPNSRIGVGYNVQTAVDVKHKLIVEAQVHNNVTDLGLLAETSIAACENLNVTNIDVVADKGYFKIEDIQACEAAGVTPYVPKPQRGPAISKGLFPKEAFEFDAAADLYRCPGGHELTRRCRNKVREGVYTVIYRAKKVCGTCPLKASCTQHSDRQVSRYEDEAVLEEMAERLAARPEILDQRRETVEHPFGTIKQWMEQRGFLTRGLESVRGEFSLTALAYNLRRAINVVGTAALITATQA